jgi:hypothetical protein
MNACLTHRNTALPDLLPHSDANAALTSTSHNRTPGLARHTPQKPPQVPHLACIQKNVRKPGDLRPTFDLQSLQVVPFTAPIRLLATIAMTSGEELHPKYKGSSSFQTQSGRVSPLLIHSFEQISR